MPHAIHRVLVIDDERDVRDVISMTLNVLEGWEVLAAQSGWEGLLRAQTHRPDLILLDVMMPGMDGEQTLAALKSLPATRDIPVIIMTAKVRFEGAGVILKPFDPMSLAGRIQALIDSGEIAQSPPGRQTEHAEQLASLWVRHRDDTLRCARDLALAARELSGGRLSEHRRIEAADLAHRLAGTAGLFGLLVTGERCAALERILRDETGADAVERGPEIAGCVAAEFAHAVPSAGGSEFDPPDRPSLAASACGAGS